MELSLMTIVHWFPGHMAKARRSIYEKLKMVDVVWEVVDARLPYSTYNILKNEQVKRVILLNKSDLADKLENKKWLSWFLKHENTNALLVNGQTGMGLSLLKKITKALVQPFNLNRRVMVRVIIIGVPNVGKSSIINRIASKRATGVGNRPGITRGEQWVTIDSDFELLDTPGVLWPKISSTAMGMRLALSGAIKREILPVEDVARYLLAYLSASYPDRLATRYGRMANETTVDLLTYIAKLKGCLIKGGSLDLVRAAQQVLEDLKQGHFGPVTFETIDNL